VVGGGNSAGQAAVVSRRARQARAHTVRARPASPPACRAISYAASRTTHGSRCARAPKSPRWKARATSDRVRWRGPEGEETREIRHVFAMTGAAPSTRWLAGVVSNWTDRGSSAPARSQAVCADRTMAAGPLAVSARNQHSRPFRGGRCPRRQCQTRRPRRWAKGSIAVSFVHQVLAE